MKAGRKFRDRMGGVARIAADYVRDSAIYTWLTKEPEPEVIVIDLRETRTVGPFIRLLDSVVDRLAPIWNESRVKVGVDRGADVVERGLDTRPGRLLVALLEPPEPPGADETDEGTSADDETDERTDR
jgi:hypothetical protein